MTRQSRTLRQILILIAAGACAGWGVLASAQDTVSPANGVLTDRMDLQAAHEVITKIEDRPTKYLYEAEQLFKLTSQPVPTELFERMKELLAATLNPKLTPDEQAVANAAVSEAAAEVRVVVRQLMPKVAAWDPPDDDGYRINIAWHPQPDAAGYIVERQKSDADRDNGDWLEVLRSDSPTGAFQEDSLKIRKGQEYVYRISVLPASTEADSKPEPVVLGMTPPVKSQGDYWNDNSSWFAVFVAVICGSVIFWIIKARSGVDLKIRKIAGLEAVDEAVGRATEMGRPILFVPGIRDMDEIQTLAGVTVLGRVARTAADHDAELEVPVCMPLVLTAARETVQASYTDAGRPDAYDEKKIYFTTQEQFGYVATVTGTMVREEPATCFYMGAFFAESLILAETANAIGSIQIAGTAMPAQLPFFVAACDYTLIGEEFYAASAYLSGDALQLGSLKGQDFGKLLVGLFLVVGVLIATMVAVTRAQYSWLGEVLNFITFDVLNVSGD
jgi:hypothetical protein